MRAMIHQSQLTAMRHWYLPRHLHQRRQQSFTEWLETHVGEFGQDWGRSYDMAVGSETYGTTWWFRDPAAATLTLLRWS
jgi:hypothetical protein